MTAQVAIITKVPRPGRTKRRLACSVGFDAAASFHEAFVHDQLETLRRAGLDPMLVHDPPADAPERQALERLANGARLLRLSGQELAADLLAAFQALCPHGPTVILSGDVPHLRAETVGDALERLATADLVLGACPDGGYWLVAMCEPHDVFTDIPMGTEVVVEQTCARARALGLTVDVLEGRVQDIDTIDDLNEVAHALPRDGHSRRRLQALLQAGGAPSQLPLPTRLHLELTNRCNSRCATCYRTAAPELVRDLSVADVERIVGELPVLDAVALQVNGEPLLHLDLLEILSLLKGRGAFLELNSNGIALRGRQAQYLIEGGLDQLNISLDAASAATYERHRGVDAFQRVVQNLSDFLELRGPAPALPKVTLWMTVTQYNLMELPELVELAARHGAEEVHLQRLVFFGAGLARETDSLHGKLTAQHRQAIRVAQERASSLGITLRACGGHSPAAMLEALDDPTPWQDCRRPWGSAVVMANGDVVPCCISTFVASRPEITMGNVLESTWSAIWNGESFNRHRAGLLVDSGPECCRGCGVCWSL